MKAIIQRVSSASVTISGTEHSRIGKGLLILLGIKTGDTEADARYVAEKCAALRIFEDAEEKMNLSVNDVGGAVLVVSQFTIYGDTRKGNRPSFVDAAPPKTAEPLYDLFVSHMRTLVGNERVGTGVFRAMMDVALVNDGPVTVIVESK
jgi:D-tyrosyl-tRNA(Tyr) deacylase